VSCKQTTSHVTETAGIEVFSIPKNESTLAGTNRLVKDRSRKLGSIPERSLTKLAVGITAPEFAQFSLSRSKSETDQQTDGQTHNVAIRNSTRPPVVIGTHINSLENSDVHLLL